LDRSVVFQTGIQLVDDSRRRVHTPQYSLLLIVLIWECGLAAVLISDRFAIDSAANFDLVEQRLVIVHLGIVR
jgi:hypothetical protein